MQYCFRRSKFKLHEIHVGVEMPHSLVLNLPPQSPIPPQFFERKAFTRPFLTLVSSVDRQVTTSMKQS